MAYTPGALSALLGSTAGPDDAGRRRNPLFQKEAKYTPQQLEMDGGSSEEKDNTEEKDITEEVDTTKKRKRRKTYDKVMTEEEKKRTVFVGNLPIDITKKALKGLFQDCGPIESLRLRSAVPRKPHMPKKAAVITREMLEAQETLNGYVKFRNEEAAQEALQVNGTIFNGRHMQVDSCTSSKRYDENRTVFLGNLSFDAEEEGLYEHFSDCGDIETVRLVRDKITGKGKGFGFVVFKDPTSVSFALKLDGSEFKNRSLRITRVVKKRKLTGTSATGSAIRKKQKKNNQGTVKVQSNRSASSSTVNAFHRPSKRVRELVKKRKSKNKTKSYMSTH